MTWETRDLPVLRAIVELSDEGERAIMPAAIEQRTGFDHTTVVRSLRALANESPPFFKASEIDTGEVVYVTFPTGHARRTVGTWPPPDAWIDRLVSALNDSADQTVDPQEKSKLRTAAQALGSLGRDVVAEVLAAYAVRATS